MYTNQSSSSSNNSGSFPDHLCQDEPRFLCPQRRQPLIPSLPSQIHSQLQDHMLNISHQCIATLKGENSYTSSLLLSGKFLFTGSSGSEIRSWKQNSFSSEIDLESPDYNMVMAGNGSVKSLVVSADKIFSAHQDHKIRVWKLEIDETDNSKLTHLATLPKLSDRALKFLDPKNHVEVRRHKKCTWVHHVDTVSALALSCDESLLYSVSWDRTLKIWRTTDFKCLESIINAHDDAINAVALSVDGYVYTASADKKIKVWRKSSEENKHCLVTTMEVHDSGVNALGLTDDGLVLYSGASDGSIVVWMKIDGGNMAVVGALQGHTKSILCLAVVSDLVCSGSADKTVRIWKGVEGCYSCLATLKGHHGPVKCLAMAKDHHNSLDSSSSYLLYSGSLDRETKVWQIFVPGEVPSNQFSFGVVSNLIFHRGV